MLQLGIVSDTHGLLRPRVLERLSGCHHILHAGDVGDPAILQALAEISPVTAVRGNVDHGALASLPAVASGQLDGCSFRMTHRRTDIDPSWSKQAGLVVYGHSHSPELEWRGNCLWLNPGAAGPRRFKLPLTLARISINGDRLIPEILSLEN